MKLLAALLLLTGFWSVGTCAETNRAASDAPEINFRSARLDLVLESYAGCSGRTLLVHPLLPAMTITLRATATNNAECAKVLAAAFATNGIAVIADGDKFALVVPKNYVRFVHPRATEVKAGASSAEDPAAITAHGIILTGADCASVAGTYASLVGRKLNRANWAPGVAQRFFFFNNQTALSKSELIYALETLFEWSGLKLVPDGEKFLKPVPFTPK